MGLRFRTYGCRGATGRRKEHRFELLLEADEKPSFCPICGAEVGDVEPIPGTHSVGKSDINKAVDLTYRLVEESSEERARIAGNPALKQTNMRDHLREGDVAMMMPNNTVTQFMAHAHGRGIDYGFGYGGGMVAPAITKPLPVTVDPVMQATGPVNKALGEAQGAGGFVHRDTHREMVTKGQINKTRRNTA